jgi:hypothetical protein
MRINHVTYFLALFTVTAVFAEGKIQLKRPVSPEAEASTFRVVGLKN